MPTPGAIPQGPRGQGLGPWNWWRGGAALTSQDGDLHVRGEEKPATWQGHKEPAARSHPSQQPVCRPQMLRAPPACLHQALGSAQESAVSRRWQAAQGLGSGDGEPRALL